ncbi:ribonuclease H-like domain-containing protein [Cercophora samala]|uniref:Ribonuclease H-like domain-containing protein n=1 Tax=Cercophora samala TaxID=330535 RepID=A0AA39ZM69_9PEZI|nr:ribonuclease H-like domain-containing protein [Cercophora samala]
MESSQDYNSLREAIQPALVAVTRSANGVANEDLEFQRTVHPSVGNQLDKTTDRMLELVSGLLKSSAKVTGQSTGKLEDIDDVEIKWKGIVDVIDSFLEKADTCLDEYTGLIKRKDAPTFEAGRDSKRPKPTERLDWSLKRANIVKPQNAFEKKPNNFDNGPWKPILTKKPHAIVPLEQSFTTFLNEEHTTQYQNPYQAEIEAMQYPSHVFESREPIKYLDVETTSPVWVDTYEGVLEMLDELKKAKEIAIDLEHHDYRTYTGLLSLMQISTREKDWIVDTLVPWRHKLEVLNEVFADPRIVKVFHGAFMDIVWLQRDLGVYVVGLFDTHHAATVLGYGGGSLAFLLKRFVDFDADKRWQLADWRIRPLPAEMLYYARADTHYLLYIYDMIRNDLAATAHTVHPDGKPIERVIAKSKKTALSRYENPTFDVETGHGDRGWYNYLARSSYVYNKEEFSVFKALWNWRDKTAREEDESTGFVMNQNVMAEIVRVMPSDKKALWSLLDGHARQLKGRLDELFGVVQEGKEKGETGMTLLQYFSGTSNPSNVVVAPKALEEGAKIDIKELKSERSQLWGGVPLSSAWEKGGKKVEEADELLEIPLYYSVAQEEEQEDEEVADAGETAPVLKSAAEVYGREEREAENQEFTLKTGRKRKASEADVPSGREEQVESGEAAEEDVEMEDATTPEDGQQDDSEEEGEEEDVEAAKKAAKQEKKLRRKAAKKAKRAAAVEQEQQEVEEGEEEVDEEARREAKRAERKARKAAKKAAKEQEQQEEQEEEEEEAFDYSKAASVLKADGGARSEFDNKKGRGKKGGKKEKVFDPYAAKTGSELKGVRNRNYERAGRSATFGK